MLTGLWCASEFILDRYQGLIGSVLAIWAALWVYFGQARNTERQLAIMEDERDERKARALRTVDDFMERIMLLDLLTGNLSKAGADIDDWHWMWNERGGGEDGTLDQYCDPRPRAFEREKLLDACTIALPSQVRLLAKLIDCYATFRAAYTAFADAGFPIIGEHHFDDGPEARSDPWSQKLNGSLNALWKAKNEAAVTDLNPDHNKVLRGLT
ncbi:MAG: hypothetical protein JHD35_16375 [Sphingopyxis sp.]|nr:hypothetical protein [Sphingopyxis sp.]